MNEIYWINGVEREAESTAVVLAEETLSALIEMTGIQPDWIDAVYWLGADLMGGSLTDAGIQASVPVFTWPGQPLLDHFILHAAARSLQTGDADLVIMGQQIGNLAGAVLLASRRAMERYNLNPLAYLAARLVLATADSPIEGIRTALQNQDSDPSALACIAPVDRHALDLLADQVESFNPAVRLEPAPAGTVVQLNLLAKALQEGQAGCGLLVSALPHRPLLATLIQKV